MLLPLRDSTLALRADEIRHPRNIKSTLSRGNPRISASSSNPRCHYSYEGAVPAAKKTVSHTFVRETAIVILIYEILS
jgi:hypothetical protein